MVYIDSGSYHDMCAVSVWCEGLIRASFSGRGLEFARISKVTLVVSCLCYCTIDISLFAMLKSHHYTGLTVQLSRGNSMLRSSSTSNSSLAVWHGTVGRTD